MRIYILLFIFLLSGCQSNSLKNTTWKVVYVEHPDFDPSMNLTSVFLESVLINYTSMGTPDTTKYKIAGKFLIYQYPDAPDDTATILKHTKDSLKLRSSNGILISLARIKKLN